MVVTGRLASRLYYHCQLAGGCQHYIAVKCQHAGCELAGESNSQELRTKIFMPMSSKITRQCTHFVDAAGTLVED
jgi:hypothetical protein